MDQKINSETNYSSQPSINSANDNNLAVVAHILGLFTSFVGPLIMYFIYKENGSEFLKNNIKNSLNFQISIFIYSLAAVPFSFIIIGLLVIFILSILNLIFCIVAAVKSSSGEEYNYPISLKLVN